MIRETLFDSLLGSADFRIGGSRTHFRMTPMQGASGYSDFFLLETGALISFDHIRSRSYPVPPFPFTHTDRLMVVHLCLRGRCERITPGGVFTLLAPNRFAISAYHPRDVLRFPDGSYDGIAFYLQPDLLDLTPGSFLSHCNIDFHRFSLHFHYERAPFYQFASPWMKDLTRRLWSMQEEPDPAQLRLVSILFFHECLRMPWISASVSLQSNAQIAAVTACRDLLCRDLSRRYTLQELADRIHMTPSTLKAHFKSAYGLSLTEYMTGRRIALARDLLQDPKLSVSLISAQCGYESHSSFSAVFKKATGYTPSDYRHLILLKSEQTE